MCRFGAHCHANSEAIFFMNRRLTWRHDHVTSPHTCHMSLGLRPRSSYLRLPYVRRNSSAASVWWGLQVRGRYHLPPPLSSSSLP